MAKIDALVKDMISDVRDIEENIPNIPSGRLPEAVVWVETVVVCLNCGEEHAYPSPHPLVRFKNKSTSARKWTASMNIIRQEIQVVNTEADKCQNCW